MKRFTLLILAAALLSLSGCSGAGSMAATAPVTYSVGGTVTALAGNGGGLQLQNNSGGTLLVNANGTFTFPAAVGSGDSYNVTVAVQPSSPAQTCEVMHGTGTATANVTNVAVDCGHGEWTWMGGSKAAGQAGAYGTQGTAAAGNTPGARYRGVTWSDAAGNFWLLGGVGLDSTGTLGELNDLWKYSAGEWTWVGGSNVANQIGKYGSPGTAAASNIPGARDTARVWVDAAGNFWIFGGEGYDSAGTFGELNDLWKYSAGEWTWMGGSNVADQEGVYGTEYDFAAGNIPGSRFGSDAWTDSSGNFWLFGEMGYDYAGNLGELSDLWEYRGGQWAWMGLHEGINHAGTYGDPGTASPDNTPGARVGSTAWTDAAGNFWLFAGAGYAATGGGGYLNDLWKYSGGQWTWMGGANAINQVGVYGTLETAAAGNLPGARDSSRGWVDSAGNFWIFGGGGYDSTGTLAYLNDLWKYSAGQWTWMGGSNVGNQTGTYGTLGTNGPTNVPGGREGFRVWTDAAGNFWVFGGTGYDSTGTAGNLNDLWKYEP